MRNAFSIAELIIVACIFGILASLVVPMVTGRATEAKTAAAQDNLRMLRCTIKLYAARHAGIAPGYEGNNPNGAVSSEYFIHQTTVLERHMRKMPVNPFNNLNTIQLLDNGASFPSEATGNSGWIYQPAAEVIRLNWPGCDDEGTRYYDY